MHYTIKLLTSTKSKESMEALASISTFYIGEVSGAILIEYFVRRRKEYLPFLVNVLNGKAMFKCKDKTHSCVDKPEVSFPYAEYVKMIKEHSKIDESEKHDLGGSRFYYLKEEEFEQTYNKILMELKKAGYSNLIPSSNPIKQGENKKLQKDRKSIKKSEK